MHAIRRTPIRWLQKSIKGSIRHALRKLERVEATTRLLFLLSGLDVDTKAMEEFDIRAAKDHISIEDYHKHENQSENKLKSVRRPAQEFAKKILP